MKEIRKTKQQLVDTNHLLHQQISALEKSEQNCRNNCMKTEEKMDFFRLATEYAHEGIVIIRGGRHLYFNKSYLELTGYSDPDELSRLPIISLIHHEDADRLGAYTRRLKQDEPAPFAF